MKKLIINLTLAVSVFALHSCDRTFEEINTDTSRIKDPSVGSLLAPIQYEMGSYGYNKADDFTFDIMQDALDFPNEGNTFSRYYFNEKSGAGYWDNSYRWLKQVGDLKKYAIKEENNNYLAISMVLNAWITANLTDAFGDIPFSEAGRSEEGILKPKYDRQKDIYVQLLDDLKTANSLFDATKALSETDLFYNANANSQTGILGWKKFCNSLSLRLLTRILSKNGEVNVYERIQEIVNNPSQYPVFQNNNDSAVLSLSGISPYLPPIARPQDFTTSRAAGEFFVDALKNNNDPRLAMFFTKAKNTAGADLGYKGAPSGYALGTIFNYQPSNLNQNLAKAPLKVLIMTYSEVQFILAELVNRGVIAGSQQTFYETGVKSIIEQWGATVPAGYFTNGYVAYDGSLQKIMLQKYISLFFVDHQQWYEFRRTKLPVLPNNGGLQNGGVMPVRFMYPTTTKVMNTENYNAAVQAMGGDNINVKMWWNK
ncbi:SusD/RagB family nutrient-binding outer membrane lipoprotein [Chryseobacterium sp. MIQD13]|uniref:SusD/RagB family nutrient-binding outer membrane lipoprotein n=1 Tax=Chryseobacterium sp. MIQD13 TaxID=3422310 RepID=UPI003D2A4E97